MGGSPVAYFLTWTTYGTWLPGDERGWVSWHEGAQPPNPELEQFSRRSMIESALKLDLRQQEIVEETIRAHCERRTWALHALSIRTNHVHVLVTAIEVTPERVVEQLKAWCTRKLKEYASDRVHWWTEGSSRRQLFDEADIPTVVEYINEAQDRPR